METLRERKKQRTRDALLRNGLELFVTRGYDRTTVDEIAESVDVSQRTFFRYFASKEDVAFFVPRLTEAHYVEAVRRRPAEETPLEALRRSVMDSWESIEEAIERYVPVELFLRTYKMIEATPSLFAAHLRRQSETEEEIARIVAEREGVDADTDPRPRLVVAVFGAVIRVTERHWSVGGDFSVAAIRELTASYLDQVGPALAGNWRGSPAGRDRPRES
ncbi:TetR family transcriptional regulator [Streptomyces sp. NPDC048409]|uniref:TetR family transcriptional regulator n=1 Tax=unclassified Streptomyces TaxID=2593676 RepID=UPI00342D2A92